MQQSKKRECMLTMQSLSDHLTPATQWDICVRQRAVIHLKKKKPLLFASIIILSK